MEKFIFLLESYHCDVCDDKRIIRDSCCGREGCLVGDQVYVCEECYEGAHSEICEDCRDIPENPKGVILDNSISYLDKFYVEGLFN